MAHFYGSVKGARGRAQRLGGAGSGMHVIAASWQGAVEVNLYTKGDKDYARVRLIEWGGHGVSRLLYDGPCDGSKPKRNRSK